MRVPESRGLRVRVKGRVRDRFAERKGVGKGRSEVRLRENEQKPFRHKR